VQYYLPKGFWTNYFTGKQLKGPIWVRETHGFQSLPLWVRPNTLLALGARDDRPDYAFANGVTLEVYELAQGEKIIDVTTGTGAETVRYTVAHHGSQFSAHCAGDVPGWKMLLVGISGAFTLEGGTIAHTPRGLLVTVAEGSRAVTLTF
jgi:alpha-D-xyloside xylohydrolase